MTVGQILRDEGIERVLEANAAWGVAYEAAAKALPKGRYTGEQIRLAIRDEIGEPTHPNAWGGAFRALLVRNKSMFRPLLKFTNMAEPRSHSRLTRVYTKTR